MRTKFFQIVPGGPSRDVRAAAASAMRQLRDGDYRAIAFVLVRRDGSVATMHAAKDDGWHNHLVAGTVELQHRLINEGRR